MLKFCQSEPVKVLVDGQMNPFFRSIKCIVVFHGKRDVATTPVSRTEFHRGYHIRLLNLFHGSIAISTQL